MIKKNIENIFKKVVGVLALIIGLVALVTPLTPGAVWLIFIGLELLGLRILVWDKIKSWFDKKDSLK
jgi:uncharacterized membrane protein HdeD (DUF308 family)